ncbi:tetratricopeptide repeat protein [Aerosakkonema funiforme]|uniref:tetratricopeptide repeat protein n=1 Tax=Aerosakkonema funiforme TaxID=1246630 RepID=UPI0035B86AE5
MNYIAKAIATSVISAAIGGLIGACSIQEPKILINQKMAEHFYNRGLERLEKRDYQGAIADFNEVIRRQSSNYRAYTNRCVARFKMGEIQTAIADCDRAVKLNPKDGDARYKRADIRFYLGNKQGAIEDLQTAALIYQQEGNMPRYQDAMEKYQKYSKDITQDGNI